MMTNNELIRQRRQIQRRIREVLAQRRASPPLLVLPDGSADSDPPPPGP